MITERICNEMIKAWKDNSFETNGIVANATYASFVKLKKEIKDLKKERKQLLKVNKAHQKMIEELNHKINLLTDQED